MRKEMVFIVGMLAMANAVAHDPSLDSEISQLFSVIEKSNCEFERNATRYPGTKVVGHVQKKYDYFKKEIDSAEKFIALSATKSELSGKKYLIHCPGAKEQFLGEWLLQKLAEYRKKR